MAKQPDTTNPPSERKCTVDGCDRPFWARGLCNTHYRYQLKKGAAFQHGRSNAKRGEQLRWLQEVSQTKSELCIRWPYPYAGAGYAILFYGGRSTSAHRVLCEIAHGAPPFAKAEAAHRCGNPSCFNPGHIEWATHIDNIADKVRHGTQQHGEKNPFAKLTDERVRQIRKDPRTAIELAAVFEVHKSTIKKVRRRLSWKHIE